MKASGSHVNQGTLSGSLWQCVSSGDWGTARSHLGLSILMPLEGAAEGQR
jgi:hypothetical protein